MDKTVKLRAYPDDAKKTAETGKSVDEKSLELAMKDAQIEEERSRSLEHLKTIVQLRESLKQEQARTAEAVRKAGELEARLKDTDSQETSELAKKSALLEEEKKRSIEYMRMIEQLRESLAQEQAGVAEMADKLAALEARTGEIAVLEARIRELSNALGKISAIAGSVQTP